MTQPEPSRNDSTLGVVVIGRNEGQRLIDCLASIAGIGAKTVYVDSGSTDGSPAQAAAMGAEVVNLDMSVPFTAGRARNEGFARLRRVHPEVGLVQFVDGDCTLADGWLAAATAFMLAHPDVAIVCGRRKERHPDRSVYNALCDIEWDTPIGDAGACGGDFLARADVFAQIGGFNQALIAGEEPEMCYRLRRAGWRIVRIDAPMTHHDAAISRLGQWAKRTSRSGYAYAVQGWLHRSDPDRYCWRENARILFWALVLPVATILLAWRISPWFALLALAYPLQLWRTWRATKRVHPDGRAFPYAFFLLLSKWTELHGQLRFLARLVRGSKQEIIEYK
jgi:GT2 family glycosyltransferase